MRLSLSLILSGLIAVSAQAQSLYLSGPSLGFTSENRGSAIRPIAGIPGASVLTDRIPFDVEFRGALISAKQDLAVALRTEDGQIMIIDLRTGSPVISSVPGTHPFASVLALSPTGSIAAVYDRGTRTVQTIGGLLDSPQVISELSASQISGSVGGIAVSDDGGSALVRFVDGDGASLWVLDSSGASWKIPADQPSAFAFMPNSLNAIVADDASQSAFMVLDVRHGASQAPLISGQDGLSSFSAVSASEDGLRAFLADGKSGNVAIVDLQTGTSTLVSCRCQATGFYHLKGTSVFRLTEASNEPMMLLDASSDDPRIMVVPPSPSTQEAQ
jgi:hypothetical protein